MTNPPTHPRQPWAFDEYTNSEIRRAAETLPKRAFMIFVAVVPNAMCRISTICFS